MVARLRAYVGFFLVGAVIVSAIPALAADRVVRYDHAYLDPPYSELQHPVTLATDAWKFFDQTTGASRGIVARKSDVLSLLRYVSPVRSQEARGSCSIFSATALIESLLSIRGEVRAESADFSEEWLDYLVSRRRLEVGSSSSLNFSVLFASGIPEEEFMPYLGEEWKDATWGLARERCGNFAATRRQRCLRGHHDPELMDVSARSLRNAKNAAYNPDFFEARQRAAKVRNTLMPRESRVTFTVRTTEEAKALLANGVPLTLDLDFYFGAWNHDAGEALGIPRDDGNWAAGIVGYPAAGSTDRKNSVKEPTGHSVLVVGYDDDYVVSTRQLMADGSEKTIEYKGVYYFKNSWGPKSFGAETVIEGKPMPGFGIITQKYAHEFGEFFRMPITTSGRR